jgi:6-phosphofructokinase 1
MSGIAGGADEILIPEFPFDIGDVCQNLKTRYEKGKNFSIVVVAEGAVPKEGGMVVTQSEEKDEFGHVRLGGIGHSLANEIKKRLGVDTRVTILGHVQRGGTPTAHDRVLATRFGVKAIELINNHDFGKMVALQGDDIIPVPLEIAVSKSKTVKRELYDIAKIFFGAGVENLNVEVSH